NGVSQVQVWGQSKYAVRVQVDPDKLRAQQIGLNEVDQALQNWNVSLPTGQLFGPHQTFNIKAGGQLVNADQFKPVVITYRQGRAVRLDQVARVLDSVEDTMNATWFYTREGGTRAINLALKRQPGVNTIEVTDNVLALPFSIFGTFAVMQVLGFSLNNLSMMALILCIGFVVDDAIVMLENIVRHIENGEDKRTAALNGSREIGFTILTMTTSLAAVF